MNTTPPPPSTRVRTPPSPRHGPKYDSYEPYSPRRSSRINARRDVSHLDSQMNESPAKLPKSRPNAIPGEKQAYPASTFISTPRKKPTFKRTSSQHFSPPSSPLSPGDDATTSTPARRNQYSTVHLESRHNRSPAALDSDLDMQLRPPNGTQKRLQSMLPTPLKTPRKRPVHDVKDAARVLFTSRPATVDEVMPTPRKARKRADPGLPLDDLQADAPTEDSIPIFTDSKDRVPDEDQQEDNPFLVRRSARKSRPTSNSKVVKKSAVKTKHGMTKEIDEKVDRGEGLVYAFRGRKVFRKFSDRQDNVEEEVEDVPLGDDPDLVRLAGAAGHKPLERTEYKPRLLFESEVARLHPDDDDEEAVTDIEAPPKAAGGYEMQVTTPQKPSLRPATPPTTVQKRKAHPVPEKRTTRDDEHEGQDFTMSFDGTIDYLRVPQLGGGRKKTSPFDSWHRTKPGLRSVSTKRPGDALEKDDAVPSIDAHSTTESTSGNSGAGRGKRSRSGPA